MELLGLISFCALFLLSLPAVNCGVLFTSLANSFQVTATMNATNGVVYAGRDSLSVSWLWNASSGSDASFKTVKSKLCYAPPSQVDRGWRKTKPDLKDDNTCPHLIAEQPYTRTGNSTTYKIKRTIPSAMYFVRVYAFDQSGNEVAYGQTTDATKASNIFTVVGISGRPKSLVVATVCFSLFSVGSLIVFFVIERKMLAQKKAK